MPTRRWGGLSINVSPSLVRQLYAAIVFSLQAS
jgi:hypothetical protein